jgi:hypothetical protein
MDATKPKSPRANSKDKKQQVVPKKCKFSKIVLEKMQELRVEFLT